MDLAQIVVILSLISFLVVWLLVKKSKMDSYVDFTMNRWKLSWFTIACGISMTFAGWSAILTTASIWYSFKWFALVDPIALMIGLIISIMLYKLYLSDKWATISDLLSSNHKGLNVLVGCVTSFVFVLIVASQFVALSKMLVPYFPSINPLLITLIVWTGVFSYVFFGWFNSVTKTDVLQFILIMLFFVIPMWFFVVSWNLYDYWLWNNHEFVSMPLDYIILFSIPILFTPLSQDINLRIKSAKDSTNGKIWLFVWGLFYFIIALTAAYVWIYLGKTWIQLTDPEQAIPFFFKEKFPYVWFVAVVATLAAIVSSLDSYTLNSITSISNDIIHPLCKKEKSAANNIKIASLITYVLGMSIALFFNKVLALSLTSLLIYISVLSPIVLWKVLRLKSKSIFISSIINILAIIVCEVFNIWFEPKAVIYPLFWCVVILIFFVMDYVLEMKNK
jgi:Na+/proline symporter